MKILITGANGFVGSHLCHKLLGLGHTVYGLVRTPSKMTLAHPHFNMIKGDLNQSPLAWMDDLPQDLDACIHTAGLVHTYNTDDFFSVNSLGTKFLIESLKEKFKKISPENSHVKFKFILVSSLAAAGPVNFGEKKDDTSMDFPVSDYGRSKKEAEEILKNSAPKEWITSIVRPPMIIGPGDAAVLDIFKMVKGGLILLPGRDSKIKEYSFVCVFDLVETIARLVESDLSLILYSAHESVIKFQQLIEEIKKQLNKRWIFYLPLPFFIIKIIAFFLSIVHKFFSHQLRLTPDKIYELEGKAWTCDSEISKLALNQTYQYNLNRTIAVTLLDYQERKWL